MKHRFYKKILPLCLMIIVAVTVFSPNTSVYGASGDDFLDKDVVEVSDTNHVLTRGNYLNFGSVTLSKVSSTRVLMTGITACHRVCDKIGVDLYLEQGTDGVHYATYRNWRFVGENDTSHTVTIELIVQPGYWYRLAGGHVAIVGNEGESVTTMTDGIYIG
ncbi:MAG: hypothetical protein HFH55_07910 [Lachnospiraceae bacterium]|nr:hypothetical protein [Lachnospiraceae bacterium]